MPRRKELILRERGKGFSRGEEILQGDPCFPNGGKERRRRPEMGGKKKTTPILEGRTKGGGFKLAKKKGKVISTLHRGGNGQSGKGGGKKGLTLLRTKS